MRLCYLRSVYTDSPVVWPSVRTVSGIYNGRGSNLQFLRSLIWAISVNDSTSTSQSVALFNAQSMTNKTFLLNDFILSKQTLDFLFLTETWQRDGDYSSLIELCPGGYSIISQPRTSGRGGRLAAVFGSRFDCRSVMVRHFSSFELQLVKIGDKDPCY